MSVDIYLRVEGATGESKDSAHTGWIDSLTFNWGASQPGNMNVGGGGGTGKVAYKDLTVQAYIDKATPSLLKYCSSGKHVTKVELSLCKAGGTQIEYSRIVLEDVLIATVEFNGIGDTDEVIVNYAFQASKVKMHYWEQSSQGSKGAETMSGWDIKQNKEM